MKATGTRHHLISRCGDPHDIVRVTDHVGEALLALGPRAWGLPLSQQNAGNVITRFRIDDHECHARFCLPPQIGELHITGRLGVVEVA